MGEVTTPLVWSLFPSLSGSRVSDVDPLNLGSDTDAFGPETGDGAFPALTTVCILSVCVSQDLRGLLLLE